MATPAIPPAPPPYTTVLAPTESTIIPEGTPLQLSTGDILGIREQILENAHTLFNLAHGNKIALTDGFRVNTVKAPSDAGAAAGKIHGAILQLSGSKTIPMISLFVQGPPAETTEAALRALLEKLESMIGKRWRVRMDNKWYLEN